MLIFPSMETMELIVSFKLDKQLLNLYLVLAIGLIRDLDDGLVGHAFDFEIDIIDNPNFGTLKTNDPYTFLVVYSGEQVFPS